jgi:light-regulated signal transduction histidine kinase (bacteriophytochrome)
VAAASFAEALASGKLYSTKTIDYRLSGAEDSLMTIDGQRIHRCEDEPIHIPGAIQSFGALIGIQENEKGLFLVRTASENSYSVVGFEPDALFELRCFTDILAHAERQEFMIRIRALRVSDSSTHHDVFTISLTSLLGAPIPLFCAMHRDAGSDMIICEFELERDSG